MKKMTILWCKRQSTETACFGAPESTMDREQFFHFLNRHLDQSYETACGKKFTFTLSKEDGIWLDVDGMADSSNRSISAERVEEWLTIFNAKPNADLGVYRNK